MGADPDVVAYAARVSVWARWAVWLAFVGELAYRPEFWYPAQKSYLLLNVPLVTLNGVLHYRLLTNRSVTWRWILALSAMDNTLITAGVVIGGGFGTFGFLAYYPSLALFAVIFSSLWVIVAWTTITAAVYVAAILAVGSGLDLGAGDEKVLAGRLFAMYAVAVSVNAITRFERIRRRAALQRERELQRERIELSQTIHNTAAQAAYMIGLGIDTAIEQAGETNRELSATLAATSALSKATMWQLRGPIDMGHIFEGRQLGRVLTSHIATFTTITSVPAEMSQSGEEPPLLAATRTRLFSIAHNALTNAFRHAHATRVEVRLDFGTEDIRLSIRDDGSGLPDDYAERGHGFTNMRTEAEQMGGRLIVETDTRHGGTTVTCVIPHPQDTDRG